MAALKDRYAAALLELSLESGHLEEHLAKAAAARETLERECLGDLLEDPYIPKESKLEVLEKLFGGSLPDELMGFLRLAVEKGRGAVILPTLSSYLRMGEQRGGKALAYVVSAKALSPEQTDAIGGLLSQKLGRQVQVLAREDPALIGGFSIRVEGRLIDQTVRTRLKNLTESLKRGGPDDCKT